MALRLSSVLALASLFTSTIADWEPIQEYNWYKDYYPSSEDYCFNGCYTTADYVTFNVTPAGGADDYYLNLCSNDLKIKSIFYCAQKYCTYEEAVAGRNQMSPSCEGNAGFPLPTVDSMRISQEELDQVPVINSTTGLATAPPEGVAINTPIVPDQEWLDLSIRTVKEFYVNWDVSFDFAFALIGFWGLVLLIGIVHRATVFFGKAPGSGEASWWLWTRKNLILPATFGKHQAEAVAWTYTVPPRLESIILFAYVIMNFVMCFPAYNLFVGNQYYAANKLQLARYIADRTGFLSIAQLPMVWVFAARNDPFMWLTGWSFATYNRFHRWIARISVVHAVVHSIAYTVFEFIEYGDASGYNLSWTAEYWYCGAIATIIMSLMLVFSGYYFREKFYDLFLIVHIGMSIIFFVTLWYHVKIFGGEFNYFLYPCIAIWSIDRLLRIGRTVFISVMPRFTKGVKATATYHRTTEMVRLDIADFMPEKKIVPGLYYYLYMPAGLRGYESHPFTLCSWRRSGSNAASPTHSINDKEVETSVRPVSSEYSSGETAHTMLVRPYAGMTARLQRKLLSTHTTVTSTQETIFLEGPYGEPLDLSGYSDILVICGGSGITAAISHTHFLLSANSTTKIHIAWAVPQRHLPDDICANELASAIHSERVNMTVYLTSAAEEEAHDPAKLPAHPPYEIRFGRPDVEGVVRGCRAGARGSLAVVTCGTPQMSDVCRRAVVKVLGEEGVEVGWFNETMVW
ncbi:hypothetical protein PRZ48_006469 [Zasmidium cellare]|uniref:FAD-binding FR-type domain-containing protein n=1 Tax=Zasmidium cellare TaxID=395010 RepID=A0ABR0EN68_ZASCE|nr:hypothetical protein PRZ48_006469 [Zasmidium cellare]